MSQVIDYLRDLVQECQMNGIRATMDPRSVNPPCVLFEPPRLNLDSFHGAEAEFSATCLVPGPGNLDAFAALDTFTQDVVSKVLKSVTRVEPVELAVDNAPGYPGMNLTWTASLDWPDPCNPTP